MLNHIFIYPEVIYVMLMKCCDLCGAENQDETKTCLRCGFEFPLVIRSDIRDEAILKKYDGKSLEEVKRVLKTQQTLLRSFLENIDAKALRKEELVTLLDDALGFLRIPVALGVEDEILFSQQEASFIKLMLTILNRVDSDNGGPIATSNTYIKMANALQAMEEPGHAMNMIEKALLINPQDKDALFVKAKLLFYIKDYDAAKRCLEKLMEKGEHPKASYLVELIDQLNS